MPIKSDDASRAPAAGTGPARISRDQLLRSAEGLLDRYGVRGFSMRALAAELGVQAPSLYGHVASRTALLAELVERIPPAPEVPVNLRPWHRAVRSWMFDQRQALLQHPWVVPLLGEVGSPEWMRRQFDETEQLLAASGMSAAEARLHNRTMWWTVFGFVRQEAYLPDRSHPAVTGPDGQRPRRFHMGSHYASPRQLLGRSGEVGEAGDPVAPLTDIADTDELFSGLVGVFVDGLQARRRRATRRPTPEPQT